MPKGKRSKRVIVAMSGGVDSSVAAALLKRAGFDAVGANMRLNGFSSAAEKRARKVAKILKIPFYIFNFENQFNKKVVDYFLTEYKKGLTPNPCVVCNKEIKFGLLLKKILKLGGNYVASGHYTRKKDYLTFSAGAEKLKYRLFKGKDKEKDQSYFLWQLNQNQLKHILFPVGNYTKAEVRKLAKKFKLPVFDAPESQEICFIPDGIEKFLKKYIKEKPGRIVNKKGEALGKHQGLWFYTIGQRKGINLPGGPFYVLDKDLKKNVLIVTKNQKDLLKNQLIVKNVNWISGKEAKLPLKIKAKIRYRHKATSGRIYRIRNGRYKMIFNKTQRAVTPGQSVVFYQHEELLGGGIIC